ncbi:DNA-methyltransferase [gamma proteobacterium HTCC5015]|nr:DNA-methyltransferase [gamma proteobacterium HTCC5015]
MVTDILKANKLERGHYVEPYAGGCGLALSLLFGGFVREIHINDIDRSIWAFWNAVLNQTEELVAKIEGTPVTIEEWERQKAIWRSENVDDFDLGFSAFYLNRTNRSGIIRKAGVIGGLSQSGKYKIDCRFNKEGLIQRIRRVKKYGSKIHLYNEDAVDFIKSSDSQLPPETLFCIDPPYYDKGSALYTNFYKPEDHAGLSQVIIDIDHPWILTYDNVEAIKKLYRRRRQYNFDLNYSAANKGKGTEILVAGKGVKIPTKLDLQKVA